MSEQWVEFPLTQGKVTLIDAADLALVSTRHWWAVRNSTGFYATCKRKLPDGRWNLLHMQRFLMGEPEEMQIDHRNRDTLDNRRENLRIATKSQNKANTIRYRNNASGFKGVYWNKRQQAWVAQVRHAGQLFHLGQFATAEDGAHAYDAKARKLHGDFARCNFPELELGLSCPGTSRGQPRPCPV